VHTVAEALNLAFGDREAYVGDPKFVKVPVKALLSNNYATRQRARIDLKRAFGKRPPAAIPGTPATAGSHQPVYWRRAASRNVAGHDIRSSHGQIRQCLFSHAVGHHVRRAGHSGTDSVFSSRGQQSRLTPGHPAQVALGKRSLPHAEPRARHEDGKPFMPAPPAATCNRSRCCRCS
jgi:gamma-glutamyltranspeptidase/glutathione hydrolase